MNSQSISINSQGSLTGTQKQPFLIGKTKELMRLKNWISPEGEKKILYCKGYFYINNDKVWIKKTKDEIFDEIIRYATNHESFLADTREIIIKDIVRTLRAICAVDDVQRGKIIGLENTKTYHMTLANGILEIRHYDRNISYVLKDFHHSVFNTHQLPYSYSPSSGCREFIKFLNGILGPAEIRFLQEFVGLSLIPINPTQKFLVFYGQGADGKSVFLKAHRAILGEHNVSDVPLKDFLPNAKFGLILTEGKLLNIAEELDDYGRMVSSVIKNYVTQGKVPVQEKHQNIYAIKPTARLVFATNLLPRFRDESDGLTRRMIILPFCRQRLNPEDQDKKYVDDNFWLEAGELPGMLNWALKGLRRLSQNNWNFTEPESVKAMLQTYKQTSNPAIQFLRDYIEADPISLPLLGRDLYEVYVKHCKLFNFIPEDDIAFGRLIIKVFPMAVQSKGTRLTKDKIRSRYWKGVRFKHEDHENLAAQIAQETPQCETFRVFNKAGGSNE